MPNETHSGSIGGEIETKIKVFFLNQRKYLDVNEEQLIAIRKSNEVFCLVVRC